MRTGSRTHETGSRTHAPGERPADSFALVIRTLERWPWATLDGEPLEQLALELPTRETWRVTGAYKGRLPGPLEADVYVALWALWNEAGRPEDGALSIPTRDLLARMGKTRGGKSDDELLDALERLAAVRFAGRAVFPSGRKTATLFGILDAARVDTEGMAHVRLSRELCAAMSTEGRRLDAGLYFLLSRPASRRLMRLLDYRRHRGPAALHTLAVPLAELCAEMPLRTTRPTDQRKTLNAAHAELLAVGFLSRVEWTRSGRSAWVAHYTFGKRAPVSPASDPADVSTTALAAEAARLFRTPREALTYMTLVQQLGDAAFSMLLADVRAEMNAGMRADVARRRAVYSLRPPSVG